MFIIKPFFSNSDEKREFKNTFKSIYLELLNGNICIKSKQKEIRLDLIALAQEFSIVTYESSLHELSVITEPIILIDIDDDVQEYNLGSMCIKLNLKDKKYTICPENPNWNLTEEYFHPHVCSYRLCEGDGIKSIKKALYENRLYDFFLIVQQILKTYCSETSYLQLSLWSCPECYECNEIVEEYDIDCNTCNICDQILCKDCIQECTNCNKNFCEYHSNNRCTECRNSICNDCSSNKCDICQETLCNNSCCFSSCSQCDNSICSSCQYFCEICNEQLCEECIIEEGLCFYCNRDKDMELQKQSY